MHQEETTSSANRSLGEAILGYLRRCPNAMDTVEGVARWWLRDQTVDHTEAAVEKALAELAAEGWVVTRRTAEGRVLYSLNPSKGTKP